MTAEPPKKRLSMTPEAIRQRKAQDNKRLARDAARMGGASAEDTIINRKGRPPGATVPAGPAIPVHTTKPINVGGPDRFASIPSLPASADGVVRPIVPSPLDPDPSADAASPDGSSAPKVATPTGPAPSGISPEEARLFAKALGQYFALGSSMLLAKRPEFANGLLQMSGSVEEFRKNFAIVQVLVEGCGERCALKYNLRIPYLDEVVVVSAIGIATFGLAGKPSKLGAQHAAQAEEQARAAAAKNANPQPNGKQPTPPTQPEPAAGSTPINFGDAGGVNLS